jgi:hypothetical protein
MPTCMDTLSPDDRLIVLAPFFLHAIFTPQSLDGQGHVGEGSQSRGGFPHDVFIVLCSCPPFFPHTMLFRALAPDSY